MKDLKIVDVVVFFGIVVWSIPFEIRVSEFVLFCLDLISHIHLILWQCITDTLLSRRSKTAHYAHVSNFIQRNVIYFLAYAFERVHYRFGRLFFNAKNSLRFVAWRLGHKPSFTKFTIPASKKNSAVDVYRFQSTETSFEVKRVILYVHGGGLIVGSVPFYAEFLTLLASRCTHSVILSPEYTLVPEASYPVQVDQVYAVYEHIQLTYPQAQFVLGGDSAGAGLCQSLMLRLSLQDGSNKKICKVFYISPWLDFDNKYRKVDGRGDYLSSRALTRYGRWYQASTNSSEIPAPTDEPLKVLNARENELSSSPLSCSIAQLRESGPAQGLLIIAGGSECLLEDSRTFAEIMRGVHNLTVFFDVIPNEIHAFVLINLYLRRGIRRFHGLERIWSFLDDS